MRVLVNAANLKGGGGVQVGASLLDEIADLCDDREVLARYPWLGRTLTVVASSEVLDNVRPGTRERVSVVERSVTVDLRALFRSRYDVSFTVFGPEYVPINARHRIVGFADVTSLYPEYLSATRGTAKLRQLARRTASRVTFGRAGSLVVETARMSSALTEEWGIGAERITVVPNAYNAIFDRPQDWAALDVAREPGIANVCYVTGFYAHKNHDVLGAVGRAMEERGTPVRFVLTLAPGAWEALSPEVRRYSVNVGPVTLAQLPRVYAASDASIFPSLFEAFSVTPLEAMVTSTPLVASDRDFVRDVCGEHVLYADPNDPAALAGALAQALRDGQGARTEAALQAVRRMPTARDRAVAYLELIDNQLQTMRPATGRA